jgi:HPt (histidine-containing phosphotransfer) domain-containing protein
MSESGNRSVDESIFTVDTLLKYMGNDQEAMGVVSRIVIDALETGNQLLDVATCSLHASHYDEAAHAFHGLRGSVGTLGTKRFIAACFAVELAIREQHQYDVVLLLAIAKQEFKLVTEHASAWLQKNKL